MKVHVEPERAVGSLHKRERTYLRVADRAQTKLTLRSPTQGTLQRIRERAENIGTKSSVVAKDAAKAPRERADPLTDRNLWEHGVHQVRSDVRHAATQTGRAEAAPLAGEPTTISWPHPRHASWTRPYSRIPQRRYASNSSSTNFGRPPWASARSLKRGQCSVTSACRSVSSGRRGA